MDLTVYERLLLLNILPREGDITALRIMRKLREDLSFSEEEHKALDLHQEGEILKWKEDTVGPKDVQMGEKACDIITDTLKKLNSKKMLTEEHIPLYERFVEGK